MIFDLLLCIKESKDEVLDTKRDIFNNKNDVFKIKLAVFDLSTVTLYRMSDGLYLSVKLSHIAAQFVKS